MCSTAMSGGKKVKAVVGGCVESDSPSLGLIRQDLYVSLRLRENLQAQQPPHSVHLNPSRCCPRRTPGCYGSHPQIVSLLRSPLLTPGSKTAVWEQKKGSAIDLKQLPVGWTPSARVSVRGPCDFRRFSAVPFIFPTTLRRRRLCCRPRLQPFSTSQSAGWELSGRGAAAAEAASVHHHQPSCCHRSRHGRCKSPLREADRSGSSRETGLPSCSCR